MAGPPSMDPPPDAFAEVFSEKEGISAPGPSGDDRRLDPGTVRRLAKHTPEPLPPAYP
jgi:hypothetical protein